MKCRSNICSVGFAAIGGFGETRPTFSAVPASRSVGTGLRAVRKVVGSFLPPRSPRSRSRLFSSSHRGEQVSIPKGESSFLCGAGVSPADVSRCMESEMPAPHDICFQSNFRGMLVSFRNTHPPLTRSLPLARPLGQPVVALSHACPGTRLCPRWSIPFTLTFHIPHYD